MTVGDHPAKHWSVKDDRGQKELLQQFLLPLLSECCRDDDEYLAMAFSPPLREYDPGFDGLSETDLIGEDRSVG